ncbi:hypothetical protein NPIL_556701 [Nephila pilipes]|uniref:Uncharacterized protein n=1 Tax=Nephila pilipes TaxID=299642 RepID=A0A8X6QP67_NEPPI|nr:hypothetical protein NPIL_556701 [Nephila pilipes]
MFLFSRSDSRIVFSPSPERYKRCCRKSFRSLWIEIGTGNPWRVRWLEDETCSVESGKHPRIDTYLPSAFRIKSRILRLQSVFSLSGAYSVS